jgi:hypothetical protein
MNTLEIIQNLKNLNSFQGVYPSYILPNYVKTGTVILNLDKHNEPGSHWFQFTLINFPTNPSISIPTAFFLFFLQ